MRAKRWAVAVAVAVAVVFVGAASPALAGFSNNILITGYWPPTNNMVRQFSTSATQNPGGWKGGNWEGRGYNLYSFFPEFPNGLGQGVGDFEVDYQDTSADWARITEMVKPVAILTFSRGSAGRNWEIEYAQRNLQTWVNDYTAPFQPTPSPPDGSVPAGFVRHSSLPMQNIKDAVNAAGLGFNASIDMTGFGGGFLSEFMAYHGTWYKDTHDSMSAEFRTVAAGHIHVGIATPLAGATAATEITLRELIKHVDTLVPSPGTAGVLGAAGVVMLGRRRSERGVDGAVNRCG